MPSPWSVSNSELTCFFLCIQFFVRVINPKSDCSESTNLSNLSHGTELDLGGTTWGETGTDPVLSLLVFNSFEVNPSGVHILVIISHVLCPLSSLLFSCLFLDAISPLCVMPTSLYVSMSFRDY